MEGLMDHRGKPDEAGASSVEYGLIVVAIAAVIALIVFALGTMTNGLFVTTCHSVNARVSGTC
jgi:Flp pilus assembly pilin Flp